MCVWAACSADWPESCVRSYMLYCDTYAYQYITYAFTHDIHVFERMRVGVRPVRKWPVAFRVGKSTSTVFRIRDILGLKFLNPVERSREWDDGWCQTGVKRGRNKVIVETYAYIQLDKRPLVLLIGPRAVLGVSGYLLNIVAFSFAAMYMYRMGFQFHAIHARGLLAEVDLRADLAENLWEIDLDQKSSPRSRSHQALLAAQGCRPRSTSNPPRGCLAADALNETDILEGLGFSCNNGDFMRNMASHGAMTENYSSGYSVMSFRRDVPMFIGNRP
ncbi:hypothetical protein QQ045_017976 [Rhodiola kirilowii]